MEVFQCCGTLLHGSDAKKIVKNYNKVAKVLLEFEMLYHRGWLRQVCCNNKEMASISSLFLFQDKCVTASYAPLR